MEDKKRPQKKQMKIAGMQTGTGEGKKNMHPSILQYSLHNTQSTVVGRYSEEEPERQGV